MNNIPIKKRLTELLVDYIVIVIYLLLLLLANLAISFLILDGIPAYTELQTQLIATLTSVIPIILLFSYLDYYKKGSIGKRVAGLKVTFTNDRFSSSLVRNVIKFLPWQLGHVGVIHGMYSEFDMTAIIITNAGSLLGLVMLLMGLFRKEKRHLGDMMAGTRVELK
ncbi:RDD family protein [Bacillus sp. LL01]|uniref:RDD family protein n=1 Tax=Bacillus sp. LL01 TaxID=1665556 RepID=UPI00064D16D0|nr:RDD family protein [Bacillus sp. LL01]KMJ57129.1 RDD family protein [Bacillus sp. LL01]